MKGGRSTLEPRMGRPAYRLFIVIFLFCAAARAGDWTVIKSGGRDYVTLRNVADFYELGDYRRVSNTLTLGTPTRSLLGTVGSNEFYINNLKFILSYPIEQVNGQAIISRMDLTKVIEPVLRPSRIRDAAVIDSVVLDPGHGGYDNGAMSVWGCEKNYALDVAWRTKALLEAVGLRVYMTRTRDEFVPLEERVRFANAHPRALFIAIHFNSGGPDANGIETYTLAPRGVPSMAADGPMLSDLRPCAGNVCDAENMALACATHASLKRARFVVIRDIDIPGVLVEGGFLSNPGDARLIATPLYRQEEAQCIAIAVRNYRNAVNYAPPMMGGSSVVVRDDVQAPEPPKPVAEPPHAEEKPAGPAADAGRASLAGARLTATARPVETAKAPLGPEPAQPAAPPAQARNEAVGHSYLTPIVD